MSTAEYCELHSQPINSFCATHSTPCCFSCHSVAYPKCETEELLKAIAKMEADIKEYDTSVDKLISEAKERQESVLGWLTRQDGREKDMMTEVQTLFSEIRRIVDDCEQKTLNRVRDAMSKHKMAAKSVDKIVNVLSELKKERQVELLPEKEGESHSCEGAAINPGGEGVPVESQATSQVSAAQRAKSQNDRSLKLYQAISNSKSMLIDFENLSTIDYEAVSNIENFDSIKNILEDFCNIGVCQKPIIQLVKEFKFSGAGTHSVMAFQNKNPTSDMIIASSYPFKLCLVTQSGKTTKSVVLTFLSQPAGICHLNGLIYVTHQMKKMISVFRVSDLSQQSSFLVSGGCAGIGSVGDKLVVACYNDSCVRALTTNGDVIAQSPHVFNKPWGVAASHNADVVFVTDYTARSGGGVVSGSHGTCQNDIVWRVWSDGPVCVWGQHLRLQQRQ